MTISAAFTVNGVANPAEQIAAYGSTVNLALTSLTGASSISWQIIACSEPSTTIPTLTLAGSPSGATASFVMPAAPGDIYGRSFLVLATVSNGSETAQQYAIIGTRNTNGDLPPCPGETFARHATHGWGPVVSRALAGVNRAIGQLPAIGSTFTTTNATQGTLGTVQLSAPVDTFQRNLLLVWYGRQNSGYTNTYYRESRIYLRYPPGGSCVERSTHETDTSTTGRTIVDKDISSWVTDYTVGSSGLITPLVTGAAVTNVNWGFMLWELQYGQRL